jgi:pimeloyl-ACP methyl ester carboxylesterase
MRKYLPNVKFTAFPTTGHDVHQEQMGKILSDILA